MLIDFRRENVKRYAILTAPELIAKTSLVSVIKITLLSFQNQVLMDNNSASNKIQVRLLPDAIPIP